MCGRYIKHTSRAHVRLRALAAIDSSSYSTWLSTPYLWCFPPSQCISSQSPQSSHSSQLTQLTSRLFTSFSIHHSDRDTVATWQARRLHMPLSFNTQSQCQKCTITWPRHSQLVRVFSSSSVFLCKHQQAHLLAVAVAAAAVVAVNGWFYILLYMILFFASCNPALVFACVVDRSLEVERASFLDLEILSGGQAFFCPRTSYQGTEPRDLSLQGKGAESNLRSRISALCSRLSSQTVEGVEVSAPTDRLDKQHTA